MCETWTVYGLQDRETIARDRDRVTDRASVHRPLRHRQNRQVTSRRKYGPHSEQFKLKLGMHGEEGLSMNFPKFHGDRSNSTMFSQRCRKTYRTNLVISLKLEINYEVISEKFWKNKGNTLHKFKKKTFCWKLCEIFEAIFKELRKNCTKNFK